MGHKKEHCHKSKKNCCKSIVKAIGDEVLNSSLVIDAAVASNILDERPDAAARIYYYNAYLSQQGKLLYDALSQLGKCHKCEKKCCKTMAKAMSDATVGYSRYASDLILAVAIPVSSLPVLLFEQLGTNYLDTIAEIMKTCGCCYTRGSFVIPPPPN